MPYVQYEGDSLALLLEPMCSKLERSLQAFKQWTVLSNSPSYVRGFPFYTSRWTPRFTYFYRDILVCRGSFVFVSRWVPLGRSGVERLCLVGFLGRRVVKLMSHLGKPEWLRCSVGARRSSSPLSVRMGASVRIGAARPSPRASCPRTTRPLRGALTRSGDLALSRSLSYWSGVRGSHHYGMRDGAR